MRAARGVANDQRSFDEGCKGTPKGKQAGRHSSSFSLCPTATLSQRVTLCLSARRPIAHRWHARSQNRPSLCRATAAADGVAEYGREGPEVEQRLERLAAQQAEILEEMRTRFDTLETTLSKLAT